MKVRNNFRIWLLLLLALGLGCYWVALPGSQAQEPVPSPSPILTPSPSATPSSTPIPVDLPSPVQSPSPSPVPSELPLPTLSDPQTDAPSPTPTPQPIDKTVLHQALVDLTNSWTIMCVAAHPDDEDGTTLTILRRKYGVHTVSLFSTYGEGGQNAAGPELNEELGVIRARETVAASQIQGSEPYFLGLRDFGFSKSADETFRIWGHEESLRRMVQKIRELRPDVIITNHDTSRGHGHHQATGRLIIEAFDAAADPKRFPEQLQRVSVWQPSRLFVRYRPFIGTGNMSTQDAAAPENLVTTDPNEHDPVRGTMYSEQALAALQSHASQGPWPKTIAERLAALGNPSATLPLIRYQLVRAAEGATPLPNEAKGFLDGLSLSEAVMPYLAPPRIEDRPLTDFIDMPDRVLNSLIDWRRRLARASEVSAEHSHRIRLIDERGDRALALASGMMLAVTPRTPELVPGIRTRFVVNLSNLGHRTVEIDRLSFLGWGAGIALEAAEFLTTDTETMATVDLVTPTNATITVPAADHLYDGRFHGERFSATADLEIDGAAFSVVAETSLPVAPAVEIQSLTPSVFVWTPATLGQPWAFRARLANHRATPFSGLAQISSLEGFSFIGEPEIQLKSHETRDLEIVGVGSPPGTIAQGKLESGTQTEAITQGQPESGTQTRAIGLGQLQSGTASFTIVEQGSNEAVTSRHLRSVFSDAKVVESLRVGYLPSFDRTLEQSLSALGVAVKQLSVVEIQNGELENYDTIIIDNRGYQAHPELIAANSKLLDRVRSGATLIVFYHKNDEWNPDDKKNRPQLAPYPIILGGDRVTEEDAPVKFLQPGHRMMNFPNRIRNADFDGWIQERGLYYPKEWDRRYQALFATADKDEPLLRGGLLVTRHGRGNYIYTSMVWYRQLAAGVLGAYRMLANMISYGHRPRRRKTPSIQNRLR